MNPAFEDEDGRSIAAIMVDAGQQILGHELRVDVTKIRPGQTMLPNDEDKRRLWDLARQVRAATRHNI